VYCAQQRFILCIASDNAIVLFATTPNCDVLLATTPSYCLGQRQIVMYCDVQHYKIYVLFMTTVVSCLEQRQEISDRVFIYHNFNSIDSV
jgi:hypothetical protein